MVPIMGSIFIYIFCKYTAIAVANYINFINVTRNYTVVCNRPQAIDPKNTKSPKTYFK